ncbi:hypothetical protein A6P54_07235 [Bacillus sp. MKU004]|nr:hypothetical protein A6P54_07235 [Bacillus sp. MKU004]QTC42324.1 hypothetical protein I7V34_03415 [Bacillus sp. V3]
MLFYEDVKQLFPHTRGVELTGMVFKAVSPLPHVKLEKGLFIPLDSQMKLFDSISNGAVASLWKRSETVPLFVPNHFPLFLVDDVHTAYQELIHFYNQKNKEEKWEIMTKFICNSESDLKTAVNEENLEDMDQGKKGGE